MGCEMWGVKCGALRVGVKRASQPVPVKINNNPKLNARPLNSEPEDH